MSISKGRLLLFFMSIYYGSVLLLLAGTFFIAGIDFVYFSSVLFILIVISRISLKCIPIELITIKERNRNIILLLLHLIFDSFNGMIMLYPLGGSIAYFLSNGVYFTPGQGYVILMVLICFTAALFNSLFCEPK